MSMGAPYIIKSTSSPGDLKRVAVFLLIGGLWCILLTGISAPLAAQENTEQGIQQKTDRAKRPDALAQEAQDAYQHGDYARAMELYPLLLEQGIVNGHIYYNLGNTHQRLGHTGYAIYNYRRAALFSPRDGDVEANLAYARKQTLDKIEAPAPDMLQRLFFWNDRLSDFELLVGCALFSTLFWAGLFLSRQRQFPFQGWLLLFSGVGAFLSGGTGLQRAWTFHYTPDAVVLEQELTVRSGTDVNSVPLFILHEGAEVHTHERTGDWIQIELEDGKRGWVERQFLGLVVP